MVRQRDGARTREIGIRMALGATTTDILTLVVGDAMKLTTVGVAAGVAAAPVALRLASASVFGVSPWNPLVLVGVAALLTAVCAAAAAIPAYRAARAGQLPPVRLRADMTIRLKADTTCVRGGLSIVRSVRLQPERRHS